MGSGLAPGMYRPLIPLESLARMRNGGAAQKIMKRRGILIVLHAVVIPSVAEGSFLHCGQYHISTGSETTPWCYVFSAFTHPSFSGLQERFLASLEMTIRESDVFESPVTSHQSLEITHPCFQNLWCIASKPEAPRIYMEHHNPTNAHSFEAHVGSKERPFAFPSH